MRLLWAELWEALSAPPAPKSCTWAQALTLGPCLCYVGVMPVLGHIPHWSSSWLDFLAWSWTWVIVLVSATTLISVDLPGNHWTVGWAMILSLLLSPCSRARGLAESSRSEALTALLPLSPLCSPSLDYQSSLAAVRHWVPDTMSYNWINISLLFIIGICHLQVMYQTSSMCQKREVWVMCWQYRFSDVFPSMILSGIHKENLLSLP